MSLKISSHKSWALRCVAIVLMTAFITACGYHLRGALDLPSQLQTIYVQGASPQLHEQFEKALAQSSVKMVQSVSEAGMIITVSNEGIQKRALSLGGGGRANEFGLTYSLNFQITNAKNEILVGSETAEVKRQYFNNQDLILAKDNEEAVIRTEMYNSAVRNIINRASAELKAKQK